MGAWRREDGGSSQWPKSVQAILVLLKMRSSVHYKVMVGVTSPNRWTSRSDCLYMGRNGHNFSPLKTEIIFSVQMYCGHLRLEETKPAVGVQLFTSVPWNCSWHLHTLIFVTLDSVCTFSISTDSKWRKCAAKSQSNVLCSYSQPLQILYAII